jgi:serine/threonine protein kinase
MIGTETNEFVILNVPYQFGNYTVGKVIGQGSTCTVFEATDRSTGKDYAVKVMSLRDLQGRTTPSKVETELAILARVSHDHVIQFREVIRTADLLLL